MNIAKIKEMKVGEWFSHDGSLYYITGVNKDGIFYSSNNFLYGTSLFIGFEDKYSLIHEGMNYIGRTRTNFLFWIMPMFIAELMCPYVVPNIKLTKN